MSDSVSVGGGNPTNQPDLDAIKAACEVATPAPWELYGDDDDVIGVVVCEMWPTQIKVIRSNARKPFANTPDVLDNAEFIARSREWVPALVAAVEAARADLEAERQKVAELRTALDETRDIASELFFREYPCAAHIRWMEDGNSEDAERLNDYDVMRRELRERLTVLGRGGNVDE